MNGVIRHRVLMRDGVAVAASRRAASGRPTIVFVNSLAATQLMWSDVQAALGDRFDVVTFDARGHGGSDAPDGAYSVRMLADDLGAVIDALGLDRPHVCGLSLGGITAMQLALAKPSSVGSLILANTSAGFAPSTMWIDRAAMARAGRFGELIEPTLQRWFTAAFRDARPEVIARAAEMIATVPAAGYAGCCEALAAADLWSELPRIACPTMVVVGAHDVSTTPATGERIAAAIPDGKFVSLDAAHLSALERPVEFASSIERFVDLLAARAAA